MKKYGLLLALVFCSFLCLAMSPVYAQENEIDAVTARKEQAKQLGLEEWIDDEGFLVDAFYANKSDGVLSEMGIDGMVRTLSQEELEAYVECLNLGIAVYDVTYYKKVSQVNPSTGGTLYTGVFEVDGVLAYCIERSVTTPPKGSSTGTPQEVTNSKLRKVLYYGYNGPQDKGYTYVETALAAGEANGDGDNSLGRNVLAQIVKLEEPPSSFKVWKVTTNGGSTQDLAYYTLEQKGKIQIKKVSANPEITDGKSAYSLSGAVFGVYADASCLMEVGRLTTDAAGNSETIELEAGNYFLKELTAPNGYLANLETATVLVEEAKTIVVTVANEPRANMGFQLPNTGGTGASLVGILGAICFGMSFIRKGEQYE